MLENYDIYSSNNISLLYLIILVVAEWKLLEKAEKPGWACLIPLYNIYMLFDIIYDNGWKMLWLLCPFVNIYYLITMWFKLANAYGKGIGFGFGLLLINPIFILILGFDNSKYFRPSA